MKTTCIAFSKYFIRTKFVIFLLIFTLILVIENLSASWNHQASKLDKNSLSKF